jgi:4-amino-4-deoxy-L-arabinose transferase-like glycosyltransferase
MPTPDHTPRATSHVSRLPRYALLITILSLAAYLRLNHLEWTEFKLDEAHLSQLAYDMARHGQIPLMGIGSSVGVVNPPLAAWLLALPYALSASPMVATGFIAALNVLAVLACYGLARRLFHSNGAALMATLLFAVAPWAIIHSRKIWAQDLLPPFVVLWAWLGYRAFVQGKRWSLPGHGLMLAAAIQLHYSAVYLIPVSAVWFVAFMKRVQWRAAIVTGLLVAAAFAPFLLADGLRGWPSMTRLLTMTQQPVTVDGEALHFAWITTTGEEIHSLAGPQEYENYRAEIVAADGLLWLEGALVVIGLLLALSDAARSAIKRAWSPRGASGGWLAAWLVLPIVMQIGHRTPVYPHYFIILYPAQFLLIGWLIARAPKWPRIILAGALLLTTAAQVQQTLVLQAFLASRSTPGGAGLPIGYTESIAREAVQAMTERGAAEIIVNTRGVDPAADEYPAVFSFLLSEVPHRCVDVFGAARVYPKDTTIQIDFLPDGVLPRPTAGREPIGRVALRAGERAAAIYAVPPYASIEFDASAIPLARWANGVGLMWLTARDPEPGQTATLAEYVRVDSLPAPAMYQWTNQLFDTAGKRWAQVDAAGYPAQYWRLGDIIGYEFKLDLPGDLPGGEYVLRVGQYTLPDVATVPVIDAAGLPQSDAFELRMVVKP